MSGIIGDHSKSGVIGKHELRECYAHLSNCSTGGVGDMTFGTLTGDSTNITQSGANVTLVKGGIYLITCSWIWYGEDIRYQWGTCLSVSGTYSDGAIFASVDAVGQQTGTPDYGGATGTFIGIFAGGDVFKFMFTGEASEGNTRSESHASIIKLIT